jgi:small subunit ribosomal protein S9
MNILHQSLRSSLRRAVIARPPTSPFISPGLLPQTRHLHQTSLLSLQQQQTRPKRRRRKDNEEEAEKQYEDRSSVHLAQPDSPAFYTGRAIYYDQVVQLESAIAHAKSALRNLQLLPLPEFARASIPPRIAVWKTLEEMNTDLQSKLSTSRYRSVVALLNELNDCLRIASASGCKDLEQGIDQILSLFESGKRDAFLARGKRKKVVLDDYGRSYTLGKRKTSSARVWMIPTKTRSTDTDANSETIESMFGIDSVTPAKAPVSTTTILVNNIPLAEYFPVPADRERITRPLKVAGVLGAYNIFALTRGGGTTGQSGALAHGIAKGLVAHEASLDTVLRRGKSFPTALISYCSSADPQQNFSGEILVWLKGRRLVSLRLAKG